MTPESSGLSVEPKPPAAAAGHDESEAKPPIPPSVHQDVRSDQVGNQVNAERIEHQHNYFPPAGKLLEPVDKLLEDLLKLPEAYHPYRHPDHERLVSELEQHRILTLTSYKEEASFVAAHALANDATFAGCRKRVLYATRRKDRDREDLDLMSLTEDVILDKPQVLLIEIAEKCTLLGSVLDAAHGARGRICSKLEQKSSYIVLSIDDCLLEQDDAADRIRPFNPHSVSHLQYLFSRNFPDQTTELEARLLAAAGPLATPADRREEYRRVTNYLAQGTAAFLKYLADLEAAGHMAPQFRALHLRTIAPESVFKEDSAVHKAAAFVATSLPELNQRDFDRVVHLILWDETATTEEVRHAFRRDGKLVTVRDRKQERCTDRWSREADDVFHDCRLRTVSSANGSWVVDFSEPYLRADLRSHLNERHPWYLRRQYGRLLQSNIFFDAELSPKAVEGLVQLFVERAIADPAGSGSIWLLDLLRGGHRSSAADSAGEPAGNTNEWLATRLADDDARLLLTDRLTILIREMAGYDVLRPTIRQFFEYLLRARQHDAFRQLILDLAPRLRYVPDFDPFIWIRRLLNEGSKTVRERTRNRLVDLARRAGPRIYEFLATIHSWIPRGHRAPEDYSFSECVALQFPFTYCIEMARWVTPGVWPSEHPLFYALPEDPADTRAKIAAFMEWLVDTRGAAFETADRSDPLKTAEAVRIAQVADLVEHWAWVLEGGPSQTPPHQGKALFELVLQELVSRLTPAQRTWLQRAWQRRQEEQLREAATLAATDRTSLLARKTKLEQLRVRLADCATAQKIPIQGEPTA